MEGKKAADQGHEEYSPAHTGHDGYDAENKTKEEQDNGPNPPWHGGTRSLRHSGRYAAGGRIGRIRGRREDQQPNQRDDSQNRTAFHGKDRSY